MYYQPKEKKKGKIGAIINEIEVITRWYQIPRIRSPKRKQKKCFSKLKNIDILSARSDPHRGLQRIEISIHKHGQRLRIHKIKK